MDILPVSFYEYLFLFALCFVSFLIGWFSRGKRKASNRLVNELPEMGIDIGITAQKKTLRAVQTRKRGGEAVAGSTILYMEDHDEENADDGLPGPHGITIIPEEADDLKQINGIGPAIEKKLNKMGIYTLLQISEFTPKDIEKVAGYLESFPKKIEKEHWVEQAKALLGNSA